MNPRLKVRISFKSKENIAYFVVKNLLHKFLTIFDAALEQISNFVLDFSVNTVIIRVHDPIYKLGGLPAFISPRK